MPKHKKDGSTCHRIFGTKSIAIATIAIMGMTALVMFAGYADADTFIPNTVTDQTSTAPLTNPTPSSYQPRYISGFGSDDAFTVFFEDRDAGGTIGYVSTTTGPTGFPSSTTSTNIADTHFCIKDWPITIEGTDYDYRAWASVGNNDQHTFYVSNDLSTWTTVSTFTIPNAAGFTDARGWMYYGFHDVIQLNGMYYAFGESNQGQTMICRSANGDDVWEAFDSVGGTSSSDGPLEIPSGISYGWTPTGNFIDLGHGRGYGKLYASPNDGAFYLAINTEADATLSPADLETAFINPDNWKWHDGTTGPASNAILSATAEHDLRECWTVPNSDPDADWVTIYDGDFGSGDGGKALGYFTLEPPMPPPTEVWVDDDYYDGGANDGHTWGYDAFDNIQDGIDNVSSGGTVYVAAGTYTGFTISTPNIIVRGPHYNVDAAGAADRGSPGDADEAVITSSVTIKADNVTLNGFKAEAPINAGYDHARNITIAYNIVDGASGQYGAIHLHGKAPSDYNQCDFAYVGYNTIIGATLGGGSQPGAIWTVGNDNVTIEYNHIIDSEGYGIVALNHVGDGVNILNNVIERPGMSGIQFWGGSDAQITSNTITDVTNVSGNSWDGNGIWVDAHAHNSVVSYNDVTGAPNTGILMVVGVTNLDVHHNTVSDCGAGVCPKWGAVTANIADNVIGSCEQGIMLSDGSVCYIMGNSFAGNTYDLYHMANIVGTDTYYGSIQDAIDNATDGDTITVYDGTYNETPTIEDFNGLTIEAGSTPVIQGNQSVWDMSYPTQVDNIIFVNNSVNVDIIGFDIRGDGTGPNARDFGIFYQNASGMLKDCTIDHNTHGQMSALAVRAILNSTLTVENCTIEDYGRIAIYAKTGTLLRVFNSTLIGTIYTPADGDYVNYGIEIEDLGYASHGVIKWNEIYNHDYLVNETLPSWSSAGIIIDAWRYYQDTSHNSSAIIQYNDIHDNYYGLEIVTNPDIHVNYNNIYNNRYYGAKSLGNYTGVNCTLDATFNYWGDPSGPYDPSDDTATGGLYNPGGTGDKVSDYVDYRPYWPTESGTGPWNYWDNTPHMHSNVPGNVGIGTTTPEEQLHVNGSFRVDGNAAHLFFVDSSSGNVGIGTMSPNAPLDIRADSPAIRVQGSGAGRFEMFIAMSGTRPAMRITGQEGANAGDYGQWVMRTDDGTMRFNARDVSEGLWKQAMTFDYLNERMGINTNSPQARLDVHGDALFNDAGDDYDFRIESTGNTHMFFVDAGSNYIGINTSTPQRPLHINDIMRLEPRDTFPSDGANGDICITDAATPGTYHIYCYLHGYWKQLD